MDELKPCPFCGVVPEIKKDREFYILEGEHDKKCWFRKINGTNREGRATAFCWQVLARDWNWRKDDE